MPPAGNCETPKTYSFLQEGGSYTFTVAAIDDAGNIDPTPASVTFSYDQRAAGRPDRLHLAEPDQRQHADDRVLGGTRLDVRLPRGRGAGRPVRLAAHAAQLADGDHSFSVKATDPAGNVQKDSTTFKFTSTPSRPAPR